MKFTFTVATVLAGIASFVNAQNMAGVYFTNPVEGTVYNAGTTQTITWKVSNYAIKELEALELRYGDSSDLQLIQTISKNPVPMTMTQFVWDIPANVSTSNQYVLMAKDSYGYSYSAYFTIIGTATNNTSTTGAVRTATAHTTASAATESASSLVKRSQFDATSDANTFKSSMVAFGIAMGAAAILM